MIMGGLQHYSNDDCLYSYTRPVPSFISLNGVSGDRKVTYTCLTDFVQEHGNVCILYWWWEPNVDEDPDLSTWNDMWNDMTVEEQQQYQQNKTLFRQANLLQERVGIIFINWQMASCETVTIGISNKAERFKTERYIGQHLHINTNHSFL